VKNSGAKQHIFNKVGSGLMTQYDYEMLAKVQVGDIKSLQNIDCDINSENKYKDTRKIINPTERR